MAGTEQLLDEVRMAADLKPVDDDDLYDSWELRSNESDDDGLDEYLEPGDSDSDSEVSLPHREPGDPVTALANPFVYDPLTRSEDRTAIRLIHLAPAINFDDNLWCKFSTTDRKSVV